MPAETIPPSKITAASTRTLERDLQDAKYLFNQLYAAGVDYDDVVATLERDGIEKFVASFDAAPGRHRREAPATTSSSVTRILFAGATGVLGRATLPHLKGHDVLGLTRTRDRLELLRALGAHGVVCDVYDFEELLRVAEERSLRS